MDLFSILSRNIFIPFYNRRHGINSTKHVDSLMQSQFYSSEQILTDQWNSLKDMLEFVYEKNEFYHDRFDQVGVKPEDIKTPDDFNKIPILTKDDIRTQGDKLISKGYHKEQLMHKRTGGSTGVPLHLYVDSEATNFKHAVAIRHNQWANHIPGNKQAALWGDTDKEYSLKEKLYMSLYARTIYLDTLKLDDEYISAFVKNIREFKPRTLIGHGHSLYFFAQFLAENKIRNIKFDGIISTAETLSADERKLVEDVFGDIVFDRYGCEELSLIASECEQHDGFHISAEGLYVEVDGGTEAEPGDLIITDLKNRGMPFIRYEIGDRATVKEGQCACGRGLPRLGKVMGRTSEFLYSPDGKRISGISILDTFAIHIPGFKQVQIIQEQMNNVTFKIVKDISYNDNSLNILKETVARVFGAGMNYNVEFVDRIPMTARGKYQFSICKVDEAKIK